MVRLVTGLGCFKAIKVLFGADALTKMLCALHLLTSQHRFFDRVVLVCVDADFIFVFTISDASNFVTISVMFFDEHFL
jgi:hypothetical protein